MDDSVPRSTVVLTGATSGIGRATAHALAGRGANLVLLTRDLARGEKAAEEFRASGAGAIRVIQCDLSLQESVHRAAAEIRGDLSRIDVLINDASVFLGTRELTAEKHERMMATNYLGPFLLTNLLIDLIVAAAPSRVINVTAPSTTAPDPDDLESSRRFSATIAFGRTKAAELMFTYALARRLAEKGVTVNAYHPGVTKTGLMRTAPGFMRVMGAVMKVAARTPDQAAVGLVDLALSPRFEDMTGLLIHDGEPMKAPFIQDIEAQERLWSAAEEATGLDRAGDPPGT